MQESGDGNPLNPCEECSPDLSVTEWSAVPAGVNCDDGDDCTEADTCVAGACLGTTIECSTVSNGTSECRGGTCILVCNTGYHDCADLCVSNTAVDTCGTRCDPCTAPTNAIPSCDGMGCSFSCQGAFTGTNCETPRFQAVPLPVGFISSTGAATSVDGQVVVGAMTSLTITRAYRWVLAAAAAADLGIPVGATTSSATVTNTDGQVVAGTSDAAGWIWSALQPTLQTPMGFPNEALSMSANGGTVVGRNGAQQYLVWRATAGPGVIPAGAQTLPLGNLDLALPVAVSGNGLTFVGYGRAADNPGGNNGVWWTTSNTILGPQELPIAMNVDNGSDTVGEMAAAVSGDGAVVVGFDSTVFSGPPGRLWSGDNFSLLELLSFRAGDVNQDGSVIIGFDPVTAEPVIWDGQAQAIPSLLISLGVDLTGWILSSANSLSGDGKTIVGDGTLNGVSRAWIARLP